MHEDRRRAHQAEAHQGGLHRAADPAPAGEGPEGRHHESLADDVQHAVVVEEGPEGKLPVLSEKRRGRDEFPERARRCCICLGCLEGGASCATACTSWTATVTSWISRIAATRNIFPSSTAGGSPSSRAPSGTAARPPTATWAATPTRRRR